MIAVRVGARDVVIAPVVRDRRDLRVVEHVGVLVEPRVELGAKLGDVHIRSLLRQTGGRAIGHRDEKRTYLTLNANAILS